MRKPENVFLNQNGYMVTNTRFEVPGQTYVMSGVTSVKVTKTVPSKFWPFVFILIGAIFAVAGLGVEAYDSACCGIFVLLLGGLMMWSKKTIYHLVLTTAAGEQKATSSTNGKFMQSLRAALTNAIIDRG